MYLRITREMEISTRLHPYASRLMFGDILMAFPARCDPTKHALVVETLVCFVEYGFFKG
jgi:hypothetical protein